MPVLVSPSEKITRAECSCRSNVRGYVWAAMLIASRLPEILFHQFGFNPGVWLTLSQSIVLFGLAIFAAKQHSIEKLAGFIFALAALNFSWLVIVPWLETSSVIQNAYHSLGWSERFLLARTIRTVGAVLMMVTLIGSDISRRELFLTIGNWRVPVRLRQVLPIRISWGCFTAVLLFISSVVLSSYLFLTLRPHTQFMRDSLLHQSVS